MRIQCLGQCMLDTEKTNFHSRPSSTVGQTVVYSLFQQILGVAFLQFAQSLFTIFLQHFTRIIF